MNLGEENTGELARAIVRDLAALAEAQASLTRDLVRLLDLLSMERTQAPASAAEPVPAGPAPVGPAPTQPPGRAAPPDSYESAQGPARFGVAPVRPDETSIDWNAETRPARPGPTLTEWRLEAPSPFRSSATAGAIPPAPAEQAPTAASAPVSAPACMCPTGPAPSSTTCSSIPWPS